MSQRLIISFLLSLFVSYSFAQGRNNKIVDFKQLTKVEDYSRLPESNLRLIADTILAYQYPNGGWPLDQHWEMPSLTPEEAKARAHFKKEMNESGVGTTIENGATTLEIFYLARVFQKTGDIRYMEAAKRGIEYLLNMQYPNGGWPLYWPSIANTDNPKAAYSDYITFNNDVMLNVMQLLRDVSEGKAPYVFAQSDESLRARCLASFYQGVLCILDCQVKKNNELTVWAQQYNQETLQPAKARDFEVPALTGCGETVSILSLLMDIPDPSERVMTSVTSAVHWLERHAIHHKKLLHYVTREGKTDVKMAQTKDTTLIWSHYYSLETDRPFFSDYDGIERNEIGEISQTMRNSYVWVSSSPSAVIRRYYKWIPEMRRRLKNLQQ